jgi:hypothetical protein
MRIAWPVWIYERTCTECGYRWEVPRAIARPSLRGVPITRAPGVVRDVIDTNAALSERAAATRRCMRCESRRYQQRLIWTWGSIRVPKARTPPHPPFF